MFKLLIAVLGSFGFVMPYSAFGATGSITDQYTDDINYSAHIEIAKGRLFIGMTKLEAFEARGTPYRVRRLQGEDGKEMWIYRCNNDDGFDEDCLYLYFKGDELEKIERP